LSFCQTEEVDKLLKGWVFEQTIVKCLQEEFNNEFKIEQQFKFSSFKIQGEKKSRGTADLVIESNGRKFLVEIKHTGIFSMGDIEKYEKYRKLIEDNGFRYLYLSKSETYKPYAEKYKKVFGEGNVFLLDVEGDWERFITLGIMRIPNMQIKDGVSSLDDILTISFMSVGGLFTIIGVPVVISGSRNKSKSKTTIGNAVNTYNNGDRYSNTEWKFGVTGNGVGLVLNF